MGKSKIAVLHSFELSLIKQTMNCCMKFSSCSFVPIVDLGSFRDAFDCPRMESDGSKRSQQNLWGVENGKNDQEEMQSEKMGS